MVQLRPQRRNTITTEICSVDERRADQNCMSLRLMSFMISLFEPFSTWSLPRRQFSPERWAQVRGKGRGLFVLRQTFSFAVFMIAVNDVATQLFDDSHPFTFGFFSIVVYAMVGICLGYELWREQEGKYKKAQLRSFPQISFRSINPH